MLFFLVSLSAGVLVLVGVSRCYLTSSPSRISDEENLQPDYQPSESSRILEVGSSDGGSGGHQPRYGYKHLISDSSPQTRAGPSNAQERHILVSNDKESVLASSQRNRRGVPSSFTAHQVSAATHTYGSQCGPNQKGKDVSITRTEQEDVECTHLMPNGLDRKALHEGIKGTPQVGESCIQNGDGSTAAHMHAGADLPSLSTHIPSPKIMPQEDMGSRGSSISLSPLSGCSTLLDNEACPSPRAYASPPSSEGGVPLPTESPNGQNKFLFQERSLEKAYRFYYNTHLPYCPSPPTSENSDISYRSLGSIADRSSGFQTPDL